MGDMIRCGQCGTHHYRNDPCPDDERKRPMSTNTTSELIPAQSQAELMPAPQPEKSTAIAKFDSKAAAAAYDKFNAQIASVEPYGTLTVANNGIKLVENAHKSVKALRKAITDTHKELKEDCNAYAKVVDSVKRQLLEKTGVIEDKLAAERAKHEAAQEAERKRKELERMAVVQTRIDKCSALAIPFVLVELQGMTDEDWVMWFGGREKEAAEKAAIAAEERRVADEMAEKLRLEREKKIADEAEAARLFAEQQQKEREALAEKMRLEHEEQQRKQAEELRIRAEELEAQRKADELIQQQRLQEFEEQRLKQVREMQAREEELEIRRRDDEEKRKKFDAEQKVIADKQAADLKAAALLREQEIQRQEKAAEEIRERERQDHAAHEARLEAERKALEAERLKLQRQKNAAEADRLEEEENRRFQTFIAEEKQRLERAAPELEKLSNIMADGTRVINDRLKDMGVPWWGPEMINRLKDLHGDMVDFVKQGEES